MRPGAKKQVHRAEEALHKYRAQAAAILHAEGLHGDGTEHERRQAYVYRILRHRETGVRVRVLDTEAPDAPAESRAYALHRYSVQCQTHDTVGDSFVSAKAALSAARRSDEWCSVCMSLMSVEPKTRARMRTSATHSRRDQSLF
jgi:hypothetical protein